MARTLDAVRNTGGEYRRVSKTAREAGGAIRARGPSLEPKKKIGGIGFWLIVGFAVLKDAADVLLAGTIVLSVVASVITLVAYLTLFTYLAIKSVPLWGTRRLATYAVSFVVEIIPFLGALPAFTLMVFTIRVLENNRALKRIAQRRRSTS